MQKDRLTAVLFSLSINPLYGVRGSFTQGELEGGKARLELNQMSRKALPCKACVERSDYFRAARRHKNNDIISGCRKSQRLFRQPEKDRLTAVLFSSDTVYTPSFSRAASFSALQKMEMACSSSLTGGKDGAMRILLSRGSMP